METTTTTKTMTAAARAMYRALLRGMPAHRARALVTAEFGAEAYVTTTTTR